MKGEDDVEKGLMVGLRKVIARDKARNTLMS